MSAQLDETAADEPVRDVAANLSRLADAPVGHPGRVGQDVLHLPREELEDRYLRQYEETLRLKEQTNSQNDKIKKLGTKLMRLVKDRRRMEQLAAGGAPPPPGVRDVGLEEVVEALQEKVRGLQAEGEGLRRRLLGAKQQLLMAQRAAPYGHVQPRVHSGLRTSRDDAASPLARPKSSRSLEGGARPPIGQLPRYGHSLLEEARAQIRNLENLMESQRSRMEEVEAVSQLLREELRKKEAECEEHLLQLRQRSTSTLRSQVSGNVTLIKLQKQLDERSHTVSELESRFLHLQQSQRAVQASHQAAMLRVEELSAQLKEERTRRVELEERLQSASVARVRAEQLQQQISELEQERDLLKENNQKLVNSALDVSQQQRQRLLEQQLRLQISQLEASLKADLLDKNQILDQIRAERDSNQKLTEEKRKLEVELAEQNRRLEALGARDREHDVDELTEALLLVKRRRSQRTSDLSLLHQEEEQEAAQEEVRRLRAAHTETIQELEKTRSLLMVEKRISQGYKAELQAALQKMESGQSELEQQLTRQAQLLDTRGTRIKTLEAQLRNAAYGSAALRPASGGSAAADQPEEAVTLDSGECLVELQVVGATLPPSALQAGADVSTFCTYAFYQFPLHSTPVVTGAEPRYGYTSRYVVRLDRRLLDYLQRSTLRVELHRALGLDWRPLASGGVALRPLLEQDGRLQGSVELRGSSEDSPSGGSLQFWIKMSPPMTETVRLYRERLQAASVSPTTSTLTEPGQPLRWNELLISVTSCSDLRSVRSQQPSPYVVYKFWDFPDHPTATATDCAAPRFHDLHRFPVAMDDELHLHLRSERLLFYVFDDKDQQVEAYLGKAGVPLEPLLHRQTLTGGFPLHGASGLPAGHIYVTLQWKLPYVAPHNSTQDGGLLQEEEEEEEEEGGEGEELQAPSSTQPDAEVETSTPDSHRATSPLTEAATNKKVTFKEPQQLDSGKRLGAAEEDQSHVSEGQLVAASDDSEISEELPEDESDSDDCIVLKHSTGRKASERLRVEIVSLSLRAESRVSRDDSVVRLFVEYSFLDLPTEETPVSLPKPPPGRCINYNHSKVVPVDAQTNMARRRLIRGILQGRNPLMERIRFTVVSEPPEEEEQERECEDVGVASLRLSEVLERRCDLTEENLDVVADSGELLGSLTVSLEALEALQSIMEDEQVEARLPDSDILFSRS